MTVIRLNYKDITGILPARISPVDFMSQRRRH